MVQVIQQELTLEKVQQAVNAIINVLELDLENTSDLHKEALSAFTSGDYQKVKRLSAINLSDNFCKALGYLGGAFKLTPNTDTILAESARAAAEYTKEVTLRRLGNAIAQALN
jgi:hypothetical protein